MGQIGVGRSQLSMRGMNPRVIRHRGGAALASFVSLAFFVCFFPEVSCFSIVFQATCTILTPQSQAYSRRTREKSLGKALEDISPKGEAAVAEWARFRDGLGKVDTWYAKNGGKRPFLLGETPSWGHIIVASYLNWTRKVWGDDSQQWKDILSWNNGRWAAIIEALKKYQY
jgi:glutathione S-transferase